MLKIKEYDEIIRNHEEHSGKANYTVLASYRALKQTKNELLDINDGIWSHEMDSVVAEIRKLGITEFTVSSACTLLLEMLAGFEQRGIKVAGFRNVNTGFEDFETGKPETKPAILMKVE